MFIAIIDAIIAEQTNTRKQLYTRKWMKCQQSILLSPGNKLDHCLPFLSTHLPTLRLRSLVIFIYSSKAFFPATLARWTRFAQIAFKPTRDVSSTGTSHREASFKDRVSMSFRPSRNVLFVSDDFDTPLYTMRVLYIWNIWQLLQLHIQCAFHRTFSAHCMDSWDVAWAA